MSLEFTTCWGKGGDPLVDLRPTALAAAYLSGVACLLVGRPQNNPLVGEELAGSVGPEVAIARAKGIIARTLGHSHDSLLVGQPFIRLGVGKLGEAATIVDIVLRHVSPFGVEYGLWAVISFWGRSWRTTPLPSHRCEMTL